MLNAATHNHVSNLVVLGQEKKMYKESAEDT